MLRFELPAEVRPCTLDGGTLAVRCTIPSRTLEVWAYGGAEPVQVFARSSPSGVLTIPLTADHLVMDAGGGVRLGIVVGDVERPDVDETSIDADAEGGLADFEDTGWQIDYARLTLTGETSAAREQP